MNLLNDEIYDDCKHYIGDLELNTPDGLLVLKDCYIDFNNDLIVKYLGGYIFEYQYQFAYTIQYLTVEVIYNNMPYLMQKDLSESLIFMLVSKKLDYTLESNSKSLAKTNEYLAKMKHESMNKLNMEIKRNKNKISILLVINIFILIISTLKLFKRFFGGIQQ